MKKYLVYGAKMLYGFFLISLIYCMIYVQIIKAAKPAFIRSLIFLPVLLIGSLAVKKVRHVVQYVVIAVILAGAVLFLSGRLQFSALDQIILLIFTFWMEFSYFTARATKRECWLENPEYWGLFLYLLGCFYGSYFKSEFLVKLAAFGAGYTYIIIDITVNTKTMGHFIDEYSNLERLPVQRMQRNNTRMLGLQSVVTAGAMMAAPYMRVDRLIVKLGIWFRSALIWMLNHLAGGAEEPAMEQAMQQGNSDFAFPEVEKNTNILMKILDFLLEIAGWILILAILGLILWTLYKKLSSMYQQFNSRTDENGDIVENLMSAKMKEDKVRLDREKRESLFLNLSADARIRKHYKKRVKKDNRGEIESSWTPEQLEEAVTLSAEKKEKFHQYYEKARYSHESCTREEAQEMAGY